MVAPGAATKSQAPVSLPTGSRAAVSLATGSRAAVGPAAKSVIQC